MSGRLIILDLDGTCYPSGTALTRMIDARTTEFLIRRGGLTLAEITEMEGRIPSILGALALLGIPRKRWADAVYRAIPYRELLRPDRASARILSRVTANRVVVTMAPQTHAIAVLEALGLTVMIDQTVSVYDAGHCDKQGIYRDLIEKHGASATTVLGDNVALDLAPAAVLGCRCVQIHPRQLAGPYPIYRDLMQALSALK